MVINVCTSEVLHSAAPHSLLRLAIVAYTMHEQACMPRSILLVLLHPWLLTQSPHPCIRELVKSGESRKNDGSVVIDVEDGLGEAWICVTCGAQQERSLAHPADTCKLCEDERQYTGADVSAPCPLKPGPVLYPSKFRSGKGQVC